MALHDIIPKITHVPTGRCWDEELEQLRQDITRLAKRSTEDVYFHKLEEPDLVLHGDKKIILQCSDQFLEAVKRLPNCRESKVFDPHEERVATERHEHPLRRSPRVVARARSLLLI